MRVFHSQRKDLGAFLASCLYLVGMLTSAAFGVFPYVLPSNVSPGCRPDGDQRRRRVLRALHRPGLVHSRDAAGDRSYSFFVYRRLAGKVEARSGYRISSASSGFVVAALTPGGIRALFEDLLHGPVFEQHRGRNALQFFVPREVHQLATISASDALPLEVVADDDREFGFVSGVRLHQPAHRDDLALARVRIVAVRRRRPSAGRNR